MTTNITLTKRGYSQLAKDIETLITEGKKRASNAASQELVTTYWEIGKRLSEEVLTENAGYKSAVLDKLAKEIAIDSTILHRTILFFKRYSTSPRGSNIKWAHYRELMRIQDQNERTWYENLILTRNLTRDQLLSAINRDSFTLASRTGKQPKTPQITRQTSPTYLYKAFVKRVVDGDTLLLNIDLGFGVLKKQRVRLAGIDAPEIKTPEGEKSFEFILNELAKVDFVMIKTNQIDIYGRYIAKVFYSFTDTKKDLIFLQGKFLNQELLNRGLAEIL